MMWVNYLVIILYFSGIIIMSLKGKTKGNEREYFKSESDIPWWQVSLSIVAAETSALTFISVPGLAFKGNFNFLQLAIGYIIGRVIVAYFLLPKYYEGKVETAYAFLSNRFGERTRSTTSIIFIFTRIAADSVRLYATAIPIKLLFNIDYSYSIIIISIITLFYILSGGIQNVLKIDAFQKLLFMFSAMLGATILYFTMPVENIIKYAPDLPAKFQVFNLNFSNFLKEPYLVLSSIIGGAFISMASHGTDQLIIQRILNIKKLENGRKAIIFSGILVFMQFVLFLFVGVMLYIHFGKITLKPDEIFVKFIIEKIPVGVAGLIIAGVLASAISSLGASMNAISSSLIFDLIQPLKKTKVKNQTNKIIIVISAALLTVFAFVFSFTNKSVVELALTISSITFGGILGSFALGLTNSKIKQYECIVSMLVAILVIVYLMIFSVVPWTWFVAIGVFSTLIVGNVLNLIGNILKKERV